MYSMQGPGWSCTRTLKGGRELVFPCVNRPVHQVPGGQYCEINWMGDSQTSVGGCPGHARNSRHHHHGRRTSLQWRRIQEVCSEFGVHSQTNYTRVCASHGFAEIFVKTLVKLIHTAVANKKDPKRAVQSSLMAYRATPHR